MNSSDGSSTCGVKLRSRVPVEDHATPRVLGCHTPLITPRRGGPSRRWCLSESHIVFIQIYTWYRPVLYHAKRDGIGRPDVKPRTYGRHHFRVASAAGPTCAATRPRHRTRAIFVFAPTSRSRVALPPRVWCLNNWPRVNAAASARPHDGAHRDGLAPRRALRQAEPGLRGAFLGRVVVILVVWDENPRCRGADIMYGRWRHGGGGVRLSHLGDGVPMLPGTHCTRLIIGN